MTNEEKKHREAIDAIIMSQVLNMDEAISLSNNIADGCVGDGCFDNPNTQSLFNMGGIDPVNWPEDDDIEPGQAGA